MSISFSEPSRDSFSIFTLLEDPVVGVMGAVGDAGGATVAEGVTVDFGTSIRRWASATGLAIGGGAVGEASAAAMVGICGIAGGVEAVGRDGVTGGGEEVGVGLVEGMGEKSESVELLLLVLVDEKIDDVSEEKSSPDADEFAMSVVEIEVTASLEPIEAPDGA